jgi:hypothetical protein
MNLKMACSATTQAKDGSGTFSFKGDNGSDSATLIVVAPPSFVARWFVGSTYALSVSEELVPVDSTVLMTALADPVEPEPEVKPRKGK